MPKVIVFRSLKVYNPTKHAEKSDREGTTERESFSLILAIDKTDTKYTIELIQA